MRSDSKVSLWKDSKQKRSVCAFFSTASLLLIGFFFGSAFIAQDHEQKWLRGGFMRTMQDPEFGKCENQRKPPGSEPLPEGIVSKTSNLDRRPLWGLPKKKNSGSNLFSIAVGIKQKAMVDKMVSKFLSANFVVMLFHYDGVVDGWKEFEWCDRVIHISAVNQSKWWFSKRFLHPDIVAEYDYIFLWDEDLGIEHFNPKRYLAIVKEEGLEISQPALDPQKSEVHHQITARGRRSNVHRRTYKPGDNYSRCDQKSTKPPCTGWIEVMAPVFSRAAWRCVWYMIQNDLIHAWGLDIQLGYCAQGDRMRNIGVVDAEYIIHHGIPTLGESKNKKKLVENSTASVMNKLPGFNKNVQESSNSSIIDFRIQVRRESLNEYKVFRRRWIKAAKADKCWIDPYPGTIETVI